MNRIKEVLEDKGIKQTWLAEKLNKSYNMVNAYVQNRRQPSLELLYEIANILHVEARDLLDVNKAVFPNTVESDTVNIPLIGAVACGLPVFAEEHIEAQIPIATQLVKTPSDYFLLRATGDSMNTKGIDSGDLLLIKRQQTAETGDLVLALIDDEATVKEFRHNGSTVVLKPHSTNLKHQPIILTTDFKVQGVVAHVIKM
ncbi:transcriptional regulator, HTH_3 family [Formosa agariphila KMM 3901]|uniref:Transcriptional regulator, HTH_3 family n=1 Tax=Formosa agariphila (strain DSM 15362 / KCTC 12365 / LMG 23005 / KMM 3901 / M-2Alg 35-1) TaxID=1347342 RepID=T2KKE1_FORAG|nr:transcriptional regulator, HTH_3 family [Formosa agariphila KMM 3901]